MSVTVLISIRPEWCEKIINGQKTLEIRKTRPKIETPFMCYIYETKAINHHSILVDLDGMQRTVFKKGRGQIIGEFICDRIETIGVPFPAYQNEMRQGVIEQSCLSYAELHRYAGHRTLYGWHISNLVIYDQPKPLDWFRLCHICPYGDLQNCNEHEYSCDGTYKLSCPPRSWCYGDLL